MSSVVDGKQLNQKWKIKDGEVRVKNINVNVIIIIVVIIIIINVIIINHCKCY